MKKSSYTGSIRIDCPTTAVNGTFTAKAYHDPATPPAGAPGPVVATGVDTDRDAAIAKCVTALATAAEGDLSTNPRTVNPAQ